MIGKIAEFMRRHEDKSFLDNTGEVSKTLPMIFGGDFNSLPVSSVLSAFMFEDLTAKDSSWKFPKDLESSKKDKYLEMNKKFKKK